VSARLGQKGALGRLARFLRAVAAEMALLELISCQLRPYGEPYI
jgi:hypothetical protein